MQQPVQLVAKYAHFDVKTTNNRLLYRLGLQCFIQKSGHSLVQSEGHVTSVGKKVALAAIALIALIAWAGEGHAVAPLYDPVMLNVGINCQWQQSCERRQLKAMASAHTFIARRHPPLWRIHLCNRNARRSISRIDWVGFGDCLRNARLTPPHAQRR